MCLLPAFAGIGVEAGVGVGGHVPPPPKKNSEKKIFFGQLLRKNKYLRN